MTVKGKTIPERSGKALLTPRMIVGCCILSGAMLWASFWLPFLVWVAIVPLGLLIGGNGNRVWIYLGAYLGGLTLFLPGFHWLRYCDPSAWLGWLLLAAYLAFYFPAFLLLSRVLHRRWQMPVLLTVPVVWVALEYVRMHLMTGIGWLMLAHSVYRWHWTIQIADFSGVYGVSFVIALVNGLWIEIFTSPLVIRSGADQKATANTMVFNPRLARSLKIVGLTLIATWSYGSFRSWQTETEAGPTVVLLQTNLEQSLKNNDAKTTMKEALNLTKQAFDIEADLVIWPETSYPYLYGNVNSQLSNQEIDRLKMVSERGTKYAEENPPSESAGKRFKSDLLEGQKHLTEITTQLGKPLLIGTIRYDYRPGIARVYNSSILFAPGRGPVDWYDKIHLVPFGEYLPLKETLPFLRALMPYEEGVNFGLDHAYEFQTLHHEGLSFASLICFEDTLPYIARKMLREHEGENPIEFFVNQSNDGWFKGSIEADYHLAASIFRSVETRRPLLRVTNTGITASIDSLGRIQDILEVDGKQKNVRGVLKTEVRVDARKAPYLVVGDWLPQLCFLACTVGVLLSTARHANRIQKQLFGPRPESSTNP